MLAAKRPSLRQKILFYILRILPVRFKLSRLEHVRFDDLIAFGTLALIPAFRKSTETLPFYRDFLAKKNVEVSAVRTPDDFSRLVPILRKEDVFPTSAVEDLCQNGKVDDMRSAIVTSGTSGTFAYGLLTEKDTLWQRSVLDEFFNHYFDQDHRSLLIINALPMGVSFTSDYPVIPTSVRPDIVLHVIKTFRNLYRTLVIVCDPHFAKKIIDDGRASGWQWHDLNVSFVIGGAWSSNSLSRYLLSALNADPKKPSHLVLGTMGITEIGLNVFSAPKELITLRDILESDPSSRARLFGTDTRVCPEIFYYIPTGTYVEISSPDENGVGDIVFSNLDTQAKTPLFRYATGDKGSFINRALAAEILDEKCPDVRLSLHLPLIAVFDREHGPANDTVSVAEVKEALYRNPDIVPSLTGHFRISGTTIDVQLETSAIPETSIKDALEKNLSAVSGKPSSITLVPYREFSQDMDLNYEKKWKHRS